MKIIYFLLLIMSFGMMQGQTAYMKHVICVLASDSLEGRGTGTPGEEKAAQFIMAEMKKAGVDSYASLNGYQQNFTYISKRISDVNTRMKIINGRNGETWLVNRTDFYTISGCATGRALGTVFNAGFGIFAPELKQDDYAKFSSQDSGKIFLIDLSNPDGYNPHSHFMKYDIQHRVSEAIKRKASAIVFYKSHPKTEAPDTQMSVKYKSYGIPVVYSEHKQISPALVQNKSVLSIQTGITEIIGSGNNIIGTLDFGKSYTIVIGAHYDHLGMGQQGGSLHAPHTFTTHNGADDNASGIASLLSLIPVIKNNPAMHEYNYMFVAFSGEELGLLGSSHLVKNMPISIYRVSAMINMDMVGRLDSLQNTLVVNGTGTSPSWSMCDSIKESPLLIKKSESGMGPSDHASFYKEKIPVLHFFSGMHSDYHKPSDDEIYINYTGINLITQYIASIIERLNQREKPLYTATKDTDPATMPRYKVSLGIMPDYVYTGEGIRVDGTTEGKPAAKAGIQKGDIILKIGGMATQDMPNYMKALGQFSKGDKAKVIIARNGKEIELEVEF